MAAKCHCMRVCHSLTHFPIHDSQGRHDAVREASRGGLARQLNGEVSENVFSAKHHLSYSSQAFGPTIELRGKLYSELLVNDWKILLTYGVSHLIVDGVGLTLFLSLPLLSAILVVGRSEWATGTYGQSQPKPGSSSRLDTLYSCLNATSLVLVKL